MGDNNFWQAFEDFMNKYGENVQWQEEYQAIETEERECMSAQIQTLVREVEAIKGGSAMSGAGEVSVHRPRQAAVRAC